MCDCDDEPSHRLYPKAVCWATIPCQRTHSEYNIDCSLTVRLPIPNVTVQVPGATHLFTRFRQLANTAYTPNTPGFAAKVRRLSRATPQGPHLNVYYQTARPDRSKVPGPLVRYLGCCRDGHSDQTVNCRLGAGHSDSTRPMCIWRVFACTAPLTDDTLGWNQDMEGFYDGIFRFDISSRA